jgi:Methyltransferase domain
MKPEPRPRVVYQSNLTWYTELGLGVGPAAHKNIYGKQYWDKYLVYDRTKLGLDLTDGRLMLAKRYARGSMLDVGVGGGLFVKTAHCYGYDVNPRAVNWLKKHNYWLDPYKESVSAICFWDSLEHIVDPSKILKAARDLVFVSMPIYRDMAHCLISKHFRPGEHVWYFTQDGFEGFMKWYGFELLEVRDFETKLGREDILSFAFRRIS